MVQKKVSPQETAVTFSIKDRDKVETYLNKPLPTLLENINTVAYTHPHYS
jgi:hypothetical protein